MTVQTTARRAKQMAPEERRQQLIDVAIKVFAEKGIDGAKHADVARAAGVAVPTTFTYFPTREDLVIDVLHAVADFIINDLQKPYLSGPTIDDRMLNSGLGVIQAAKDHPDHLKVWLMWSTHFGEPFRAEYLAFEKRMRDGLVELLTGDHDIEPDQELREKVLLVTGLSAFLAQLALRGENPERQEAFMRNVMRALRIWTHD